jgi:ABC-type multidrug transport system fused ATPase/permease subunit
MKMNETILKQVKKSEEKYNIRYAKKDGALFSGLRITFFFAFAFAAVFALFVALQPWANEGVKYESNATIPTIYLFLIAGVLGALFNAFKISLGALVCTLPTGFFAVVEFAKLLPDPNGIFFLNLKFYWAHLIPILVLVVCAVIMVVIEFRAKHILKRGYEKISKRIYEEYASHAENLSEEEWEEFLKNYDPRPSKKNNKK